MPYYQSSEVSRASKELDERLEAWRNQALGQHVYLIQDARYEKVRLGACIQDAALLIAYSVNAMGKKRVLGMSVALSEAEMHWRTFLQSLVARQLHGVKLITSDTYPGLKAAIRTVFLSVPWQSMKKEVAKDIRHIFNAPSLDESKRLLNSTILKYEKNAAKLSDKNKDNKSC